MKHKKSVIAGTVIAALALGVGGAYAGYQTAQSRGQNQSENKTKTDNSSKNKKSKSVKPVSRQSSVKESATSKEVPQYLQLTDDQVSNFGHWVGDQAAKMNLVGSELHVRLGVPATITNSDGIYYDTVNGPLFINQSNDGKGLQALATFGFYKWDETEIHGELSTPNITDKTGYVSPQELTLGYEGYRGHVAMTTDYKEAMYVIANDGNIYEFEAPAGSNAAVFRPAFRERPELAQASGVIGKVTSDANAVAELNRLVGYDTTQIAKNYQYTSSTTAVSTSYDQLNDKQKYAVIIMKQNPITAMGGVPLPYDIDSGHSKTIHVMPDRTASGVRQVFVSEFVAGGGAWNYQAFSMNGDEVTIYNEPTITNPNDATYQWKGEPGSAMTTFNLRDAYNELIANNTGQEAEMNKIANVLKVGE